MKKFSKIEKQRRNKIKQNIKNIFGFDTETLNGKPFLICDSNKKYIILDKNSDIFDIFDFLLYRKYENSFNFFFNLRYDFHGILKYLLEFSYKDFYTFYHNKKISLDDYTIKYIDKKLFVISKNNHSVRFYDLAQYFNTSLNDASKKYLNDNKEEIEINNIYNVFKINSQKVINYCYKDALLTKKLAEYLYNTLINEYNFYPNNFISKANISEHYFINNTYIPRFDKLFKENKKLLEYSLKNYYGGRFEVIKKGYFDYCISYDINSAYPHEIRNLIDITKGKWIITDKFENNAYYGFYKCSISYFDKYISPFVLKNKFNINIFPNGEFVTYLTQNEIKYLKNLCKIDVIDGIVFYPDKIYYPFRNIINKLYEIKQNNKDNYMKYWLSKIIMNSLYGKFIEIYNEKTGNLFNPVYASI
ncbi:MAG: DNA polymerase, partial [Promethearchaeia archaeon]